MRTILAITIPKLESPVLTSPIGAYRRITSDATRVPVESLCR